MPFIEWNDNLSVKVNSMDKQHKKLIDIINELYDYHKQRKSKQIIEKTLKELIAYTQTHFADEEKLMEQMNYPYLAEHKAKHRKLIIRVIEFVQRFNKFETVNVADLLKFLQEWLLRHIAMEDKQYGRHFDAVQKAKANA